MRRLVFILMIALLPLQGWTSMTMTTHMAVANLAMHQTGNGQALSNDELARKISTVMSPDCALRMGVMADAADPVSGKICTDCHACHTIALTDPVQINCTAIFSVPFERRVPPYFASAEVQLSQKPPIFSA